MGEHAFVITRVAERQWHAVGDDRVVGRGDASRRPDGRIFLSIDAWHGAVFDQLVDAMLADLPKPLYTVVDEADLDLTSKWERAGFTTRRREWEYLVPTDPRVTELGSVLPPSGVTTSEIHTRDTPPRSKDQRQDRRKAKQRQHEAKVGYATYPKRSGSSFGPPWLT
jgi:hypothetical protein